MKRTEIEVLNNEVITSEQFDEIELNEEVTNMENLGTSSSHRNCTWYSVEFSDGESIDVFLKNEY